MRSPLLILSLLVILVTGAAHAVDPVPPTTPYSRYFLTSSNQAQAQTILGVSAEGGASPEFIAAVMATNNSATATTAMNAITAENLSAALTNYLTVNVPSFGGDVTNVSLVSLPGTNYGFYTMAGFTNFTITGGKFSSTLTGPGSAFYAATNEQSGIAGQGILPASLVAVNFAIDSQELVLSMAGDGQLYDLVVDGQDVLRSAQLSIAQNYVQIQFSSLKRRNIQIITPMYFAGVYVPITNSLWATERPTKKILVLGDSYVGQRPGIDSSRLRSIVGTIQQGLGPEWEAYGYGQDSTGWTAPGSGGYTNFLGRLGDVLREAPDALVVYGGYNEILTATNSSQTNIIYRYATNFLQQVRSNFQTMPIWVVGPQAPSAPLAGLGETVLLGDHLRNAANTAGAFYVSPIADPWFKGWANTTNSGNANRYLVGDAIHPNTEGAAFIGKKILAELKPVLNRSPFLPATEFSVTRTLMTDVSLTSDNTCNPEPRMIVTGLKSNCTYKITGQMWFTCGDTTPGYKIGLFLPTIHADAIKSLIWTRMNHTSFPLNYINPHGEWTADGTSAPIEFGAGIFTRAGADFTVVAKIAADGIAQIYWAQSTSSGTALVLKAGSWVKVERVAY